MGDMPFRAQAYSTRRYRQRRKGITRHWQAVGFFMRQAMKKQMTKSGKTPPDSEPTTKNTSLDQLDNSDEAVLAEVSVSYSGPLPPPEILTKFDKAVPGLAKRIADDAKKEQQFSHEVNRKVLESNEANAVSARWLPYVSNIFLTIIAISAYIVVLN